MKNKKSLLSLGLLALVLVLGVGYAVVNSVTLNINGTAGTLSDATDIAVAFDGVESKNETYVTAATATEKTATFTVDNLSRVGDTATIVYKIKNSETDLNATLSTPTVQFGENTETTTNDYFEVTTAYTNSTGSPVTQVEHGETVKLTVTVKLKKTPTTEQNTNIKLTFTASPVAQ